MAWRQSPVFLSDFSKAQGWTSSNYVRFVEDIDRNGTVDYVGFGYDHVTMAWGGTFRGPLNSKGSGFMEHQPGSYQVQDFGAFQGYNQTYVRGIDHVGGTANQFDTTIWGAGDAGFSYYKPVSETVRFDANNRAYYEPSYQGPFLIPNFGHNQGWNTSNGIEVEFVRDTDASASVLGFGNFGLVVARDAFGAIANTSTYTVNVAVGNISGGYNNNVDIRTFQDSDGRALDFNGDGITDFAGFGPRGLETALGYITPAGQYAIFNPAVASIGGGGTTGANLGRAQGWDNENSVRLLQDINGDGLTDVMAFGFDGAYIGLGQNTAGQPFGELYRASDNFGIAQGWNTKDHVRLVDDVNGDGIADIVGFGASQTYLITGTRNSAGQVFYDSAQFQNPNNKLDNLTTAQGWNTKDHIRTLGDVNGDGRVEIVATGDYGTSTWEFLF